MGNRSLPRDLQEQAARAGLVWAEVHETLGEAQSLGEILCWLRQS